MMRRLTTVLLLTAGTADAGQPNIVWINCEDIGPALGCYGDDYATTPHLDRFARGAILYRNAFANAPICAPARSCLITGLHPTSMGSHHLRCEVKLPPSIQPFPEYLKRAGYFTTNYGKTDYNFPPDGIYDYWKSDFAPWRQAERGGRPFFSFFVLGTTHEGRGNFIEKYRDATAGLSASPRHDPAKVTVPPYFPDTPKVRELLARYADLITAMDGQVGRIVKNLKEDGLWDDTVVWFFSDHGHGLPRHKRWLNDSGIRVPLLIHVPKKYQRLAAGLKPGSQTGRLVSFVDFAPTALSQAGVAVPAAMQGRPFLGHEVAPPRKFVYAARGRADDMYECSRAVHDGRFMYIRHYMPHLAYLQGGRIFNMPKESLVELRRAQKAGLCTGPAAALFARRKPAVELYDLKADPHEINNLADDPEHAGRAAALKRRLHDWMRRHRDVGLLPEAEYRRRAKLAGTTIYEMARNPKLYNLDEVLAAAEGGPAGLRHPDSGVRYWSVVALRSADVVSPAARATLAKLARADPSPAVAILAAETLCALGGAEAGLPTLKKFIAAGEPTVALRAARSMYNIGTAAKPAVRRIEAVRKSLEGGHPKRRYRDFNYTSFRGWALEWALINCKAARPRDFP